MKIPFGVEPKVLPYAFERFAGIIRDAFINDQTRLRMILERLGTLNRDLQTSRLVCYQKLSNPSSTTTGNPPKPPSKKTQKRPRKPNLLSNVDPEALNALHNDVINILKQGPSKQLLSRYALQSRTTMVDTMLIHLGFVRNCHQIGTTWLSLSTTNFQNFLNSALLSTSLISTNQVRPTSNVAPL